MSVRPLRGLPEAGKISGTAQTLSESNRADMDDFRRTWLRRVCLFFVGMFAVVMVLDGVMTYFWWPEWVRLNGRVGAEKVLVASLWTSLQINLFIAFVTAALFGLGLLAGRVVFGGGRGGRQGWAWSFAGGLLLLMGMTLVVMFWKPTFGGCNGTVLVLGLLTTGVLVAFWDLRTASGSNDPDLRRASEAV